MTGAEVVASGLVFTALLLAVALFVVAKELKAVRRRVTELEVRAFKLEMIPTVFGFTLVKSPGGARDTGITTVRKRGEA